MAMKSSFSATMIGHGTSNAERQKEIHDLYKAEANVMLKQVSTYHPHHKLKHMQVYYPDTIDTLCESKLNTNQSSTKQIKPYVHESAFKSSSRVGELEKEFYERRNRETFTESSLNNRKLRYNREQGRKAIVNEDITGKSVPRVDKLFPKDCNHQVVLAITNTLKMPDPHILPPDIPRGRKWTGNDKGWES